MIKSKKSKKKDLILSAGELVKNGVPTTEIENEDVAYMVKKIAANAICMGLYNFNRFLISNIGDGEFNIAKPDWIKAKDDLHRCFKIVDNGGENLKDILTTEEIKEAIDYTIFEQTGENENDE